MSVFTLAYCLVVSLLGMVMLLSQEEKKRAKVSFTNIINSKKKYIYICSLFGWVCAVPPLCGYL